MQGRTRIGLLAAAALLTSACHATFAPAVRSPHGGEPGRLKQGEMALGGEVLLAPGGGPVWGPAVSYSALDWLQIEAGSDVLGPGGEGNTWVLGFVGTRFTPYAKRVAGPLHLALDVGLGAGVGAGGSLCDNDPLDETTGKSACDVYDDRTWDERLAYGGYVDLGLGASLDWEKFSIGALVRSRVRISEATGIPVTIWPSAVGGIEIGIYDIVFVHCTGGYASYHNDLDEEHGPIVDIGIRAVFDVTGSSEERSPKVAESSGPRLRLRQ